MITFYCSCKTRRTCL